MKNDFAIVFTWLSGRSERLGYNSWKEFHCKMAWLDKRFNPWVVVFAQGSLSKPRFCLRVGYVWSILSKIKVSWRSEGRLEFKCWWTRRTLRSLTRSKIVRISKCRNKGLEGERGGKKDIRRRSDFWRTRTRRVVVFSICPQSCHAYLMCELKRAW